MSDDLDDEPVLDEPSNVVTSHQFDSELAKAARNAGIQKAKLAAEERRAEVLAGIAINAELITTFDNAYDTAEKVSLLFKAAAMRIAQGILTGQVEITNGTHAAAALKALMEAGRLEAGQHTSAPLSVSTTAEKLERLAELKAQADKNMAQLEAEQEAQKIVPIQSA